MNDELIILDLTYKLQHELSLLTEDELARFMHGKILRYDNKLYQHNRGVDDATIIREHEVKQEQT